MVSSQEQLRRAVNDVRDASSRISRSRATIEQFLKEGRDLESFGPVLNPNLFRDPERRRLANILTPVFEAALALDRVYLEAAASFVEYAIERQKGEGT